jgi:hypothetical protein
MKRSRELEETAKRAQPTPKKAAPIMQHARGPKRSSTKPVGHTQKQNAEVATV